MQYVSCLLRKKMAGCKLQRPSSGKQLPRNNKRGREMSQNENSGNHLILPLHFFKMYPTLLDHTDYYEYGKRYGMPHTVICEHEN